MPAQTPGRGHTIAEVIDDMQTSRQPGSDAAAGAAAARKAGALLILTAVASLVAVGARVSADADQPTLAESLAAISESSGLYGIGGAARLVSGITLIIGAWLLSKTWPIRERPGKPIVPALLAVSGIFTAVSGVCAIALALSASVPADPGAIDASTETMAYLRWLTGKIGFAVAGLALVIAARRQWKAGGALRYVSLASAIIGIAMQFIWFDAATIVHPVSGAAFFAWLVAVGGLLLTGRVEQRPAAMPGSSPSA